MCQSLTVSLLGLTGSVAFLLPSFCSFASRCHFNSFSSIISPKWTLFHFFLFSFPRLSVSLMSSRKWKSWNPVSVHAFSTAAKAAWQKEILFLLLSLWTLLHCPSLNSVLIFFIPAKFTEGPAPWPFAYSERSTFLQARRHLEPS